jgi:hypothetical protein
MLLARKAFLAVAAAALLVPFAQAQETNPMVPVSYHRDTGFVSNEGTERQVIISFAVMFDAVSSMSLRFEDVVLSGSIEAGDESILRITSLHDGAVQTMNAVHVQQWANTSAYFNGNIVQVEVIASPGTGENRVIVEGLEVGVPASLPETQCGPEDNRVPSSDPRVARLMPVGCTSWMINDCGKCFLSAGHCGAGAGSSVQFNVPFSTSGGSLVFPPPEDQYAYDNSSRQFLNSTDDWQYFGVFPNSNTGLTPYQAMGAAFDLVTPPNPAGQNVRITGYGTDNSPNSTYNQIQQTHVGPFVSVGTNLNYQTDTTGGNSGSPVIWEEMGAAVGIHTNGGCSTGGGGSNNGTPITATSLQAALANPKGVCKGGSNFVDLGSFLFVPPFNRPPSLGLCGDLTGGSDLSLDVGVRVPPAAINYSMTAWFILGFSAINAPFEGGVLVPNADVVQAFPFDTSSQMAGLTVTSTWPVGIGSGVDFWLQTWLPFTDGGSVSGTLATNAVMFTTP